MTAAAQTQPRVSAFGRVGYGSPGLNFISDQFESYGLAGVQVQWKAWNWGTDGREREALALQQQIVAADEAAFTRTSSRATETDLRPIDRLTSALALDDRIVALREEIDRSDARRAFGSASSPRPSTSIGTRSCSTRGSRSAAHRVELAQARARLLTTLGLEVR